MENKKLKVVLMRHGAYSRNTGELNEFGKDEVYGKIPRLEKLLPKNAKILCLTSPAKRASETAAIIGKQIAYLDAFEESSDFLNKSSLLTSDYHAIFDSYLDTYDVLFILSHQPNILEMASVWHLPNSGIISFDYSHGGKLDWDTIKRY